MTDDSATATLRATIEQIARTWAKTPDDYYELAAAIEHVVLSSQSSWAKEKAELERQLEAMRASRLVEMEAMRQSFREQLHASRPVTVKD